MPLMLINAPDDSAVAAVQHLSRIEVLAVLNSQLPPAAPSVKPLKPRSWVGLLPQEVGRRMLNEVAATRNEWERTT